MAYSFDALKKKIVEVEEWLKREYSLVRTGRATPLILDSVSIDSYGSRMAINQVASVSVEDPKTLRVVPWDTTQVRVIEKGIQDADLGLSVSVDEKGLRVIFPELTSDRRASLAKIVKQKLEEARISLRLERERVWDDIQKKEKAGELTEDDKFRLKNEMQKIIDDANANLDQVSARKEKEILEQ